MSNTTLETIKTRRSIRKFTDQPITNDQINTILEAAIWAPTGMKKQSWKFLVIKNSDERFAKLAECTRYTSIVNSSQAAICLFLDKEKAYDTRKDHQGMGAAIQNMLLAAHSLGLGALWIGEILNQEDQVFKTLKLDSSKFELQVVIPLGYPNEEKEGIRKPLSEFMMENI